MKHNLLYNGPINYVRKGVMIKHKISYAKETHNIKQNEGNIETYYVGDNTNYVGSGFWQMDE